jgi:hypothetical protein
MLSRSFSVTQSPKITHILHPFIHTYTCIHTHTVPDGLDNILGDSESEMCIHTYFHTHIHMHTHTHCTCWSRPYPLWEKPDSEPEMCIHTYFRTHTHAYTHSLYLIVSTISSVDDNRLRAHTKCWGIVPENKETSCTRFAPKAPIIQRIMWPALVVRVLRVCM